MKTIYIKSFAEKFNFHVPTRFVLSADHYLPIDYKKIFPSYKKSIESATRFLLNYMEQLKLPENVEGETRYSFEEYMMLSPISLSRLFEFQRELGVVKFPEIHIKTNYGNSKIDLRPVDKTRNVVITTSGQGLVDKIVEELNGELLKELGAHHIETKVYRDDPEMVQDLYVDTAVTFHSLACGMKGAGGGN